MFEAFKARLRYRKMIKGLLSVTDDWTYVAEYDSSDVFDYISKYIFTSKRLGLLFMYSTHHVFDDRMTIPEVRMVSGNTSIEIPQKYKKLVAYLLDGKRHALVREAELKRKQEQIKKDLEKESQLAKWCLENELKIIKADLVTNNLFCKDIYHESQYLR